MGLFDAFAGFGKLQEMQERLRKMQEELGKKTVEGSAGGGMVTAVANGKRELVSIAIKPEALASGDREMLEDLVVAAVNNALGKTNDLVREHITGLTGGLPIPGMDKLFG
jgi:DNA-binding YbaB/EbfC family protein